MKTFEDKNGTVEEIIKGLNIQDGDKTGYKQLAEKYCYVLGVSEDNEITKKILKLIKNGSIDINQAHLFIPGISKRIEDDRIIIRDNAIIVCSCLFKDNAFNIQYCTNFKNYEEEIKAILGHNFYDEECFAIENVVESVNLPVKEDIKYLQQAIEILDNNETKKFDLVYSKLVFLISNSSTRTLERAEEFLKPIVLSEHDSYEKIKAVAMLISRNKSLLETVIHSICDDFYNVKHKVVLVISLIEYVQKLDRTQVARVVEKSKELRDKNNVHKVVDRYLNVLLKI